jgi:CheY-like chemotaxis protein
VAEDNAVNQKVICSMLRRRGWNPVLAANGAEAFDLFRQQLFGVILMDVQMPETDGLEATRLIRAEETRRGLCRTPIVAITAHASAGQHAQCLLEGMDAVITKPVSMDALANGIAAALAVCRQPRPILN